VAWALGASAVALPAEARRQNGVSMYFSSYPFSLGVASGDPLPDGFVIWTRLAPKPLEAHGGMSASHVELGWEVAEDESFRTIVRAGTALARPELAHAVHVEVSGLRSRRRYWYRFHVDGIPSDIGTAVTAPAGTAALDRPPRPRPRARSSRPKAARCRD